MGTPQQAPASPTPPYTPPQPAPYNPVPQQPVPGEAPQRLPDSAQTSSRCPGCGSGNYGKSAMAPEAKARCYDCGYPVVQSGSGVGTGISQANGGPAIPAKQISTANNWNPQGIIGHI
jgi:hypothetical protein